MRVITNNNDLRKNLSAALEPWWPILSKELKRCGEQYSFEKPKALAEAVMKLSDFYIQQPNETTPWSEIWAQAAYIGYFFPLNYLRVMSVLERGRLAKFKLPEQINTIVDLGSGCGASHLAIQSEFPQLKALCIERSDVAIQLHQNLYKHWCTNYSSSRSLNFIHSNKNPDNKPDNKPDKKLDTNLLRSSLVVLSYVATELESWPSWLKDAQALCVIEPSTRDDGRRLMLLRDNLIEQGFHIIAPCVHQLSCPLINQSTRDWCHDRVEWAIPSIWQPLQSMLPIRNNELSFSYLLAIRRKDNFINNTVLDHDVRAIARVIGDPLREKGKTRQLICRGVEREFLTWFPQRQKEPMPEVARGDVILFQQEDLLEKKNQELRLKKIVKSD